MAIQKMVADSAYWTDAGEFKTLNLHGSKDGGLAQREAVLMAFGFLCFMHVVNLGLGPEPVSPFLLLAALSGRSGMVVDKAFIRDLDVPAYLALEPWVIWAESGDRLPVRLNTYDTPLASLLNEAGINVSHRCCTISSLKSDRTPQTASLCGRELPDNERLGLERSLTCRILLGDADPTCHPDFVAFKSGFNYFVSDDDCGFEPLQHVSSLPLLER